MKKFRLLLLDANVVIHLFEQGIWDQFINRCDVVLARTVVDEAHLYFQDSRPFEIDLEPDIAAGRVAVVDVTVSDLMRFRSRFDPSYLDRLDAGETESLAYLLDSNDEFLISSGDGIVYRVLGRFHRQEQGLSLEEVLQQIGLTRSLPYQFTKAFRVKWINAGSQDAITGMGLIHPADSDGGTGERQ